MKKNNSPATNTLDAHVKRYSSARNDLLAMIILTVANIVMMFFGSESMMLFSASIPYFAVGMELRHRAYCFWCNSCCYLSCSLSSLLVYEQEKISVAHCCHGAFCN